MRTRGWTVFVTAVLAAGLSIAGVSPASAADPDDGTPAESEWGDRERTTTDTRPTRATRTSTVTRAASAPRVPLGIDISWPQCGTTLPKGQAFAIIGVNGGLANNTNPCFATQLAWAAKSTGGTGQPRAALYVNTANPGHKGSWWPASNVYGGRTISNPYGTCTGLEGAACAYIYGYAKSYDNVTSRGVKNPSSYLWWLDVEMINTWSSTDKAANAAVLEGMTAHLKGIGARVGLYSTHYQWGLIAGQVSSTSNLRGLPSWLAGANGVQGAKGMCSWPGLTPGSKVTMTQFVSNNLDYDYSCI